MIEQNGQAPSFYVVRDDLLHPLVNGNKARKLDGLLPLIEDFAVTVLVTCGSCQSAHAAAIGRSCCMRRERVKVSSASKRGTTGNSNWVQSLISTIYGNATYVPRSLYARREEKEMLKSHADLVAGSFDSVVWFSDILEASVTTRTYGKLNSEPTNVHSTAGDFPTKVVIVNEGAGDSAALLGVIRLVKYLSEAHLLGKERALKIVVMLVLGQQQLV